MQMREYVRVNTVEEALSAASAAKGPVLYFAGGTDILVQAREDERYREHSVIDIYGIQALKNIEEQEACIKIGALVTHTQLAESELLRRHARVLSLASATVGSLQIRNHSTIGGNIANASPAADTLGALAILRAQVELCGPAGTRLLPLKEVIAAPYRNTLQNGELITAVYVDKLEADTLFEFYKLGRRRALAISRMTVAALLRKDAEGRVSRFEMTIGATFPRPERFEDVSALLLNKVPAKEDTEAVAKLLSDKIPQIAGIRASTSYKQPVAKKLIARILNGMLWGENDG